MWFVVAMAVAAAQDDTLRTENVRLGRENEALQLRIMELHFRQGRSVRTAEMVKGTTPEELVEAYLQRQGLTEQRLRDGDPLDRAERARLKRLADEYEAVVKRLDPSATPARLE